MVLLALLLAVGTILFETLEYRIRYDSCVWHFIIQTEVSGWYLDRQVLST